MGLSLTAFLPLVKQAASIVLAGVAPKAQPIVVHAIELAEHAVSAKTGQPLTGAEKNQLATEAVGVGLEAFNAALAAKGKDAVVFPEVDQLSDLVTDVVDTANAFHAAVQSASTKVAKAHTSVALLSSPDAVQGLKSQAQAAEKQRAVSMLG